MDLGNILAVEFPKTGVVEVDSRRSCFLIRCLIKGVVRLEELEDSRVVVRESYHILRARCGPSIQVWFAFSVNEGFLL